MTRAMAFAQKVAQRGFGLGNVVHASVQAFVADNITTASIRQLILAEAVRLND